MHQGQIPGSVANSFHQPNTNGTQPNTKAPPFNALPQPPNKPLSENASSLDDLVSGAAKDADTAANITEPKTETPKKVEGGEEKKGKKEKDKSMKLVYSDNEVSPEEKMAQMPRYAFAPSG